MASCMYRKYSDGFTLLEVLLALAIISIAFVALMNAVSHSTILAERLKTKTLKHWVALEGVHMIQLGLLTVPVGTVSSQKTALFNQTWYWRAEVSKTPLDTVEKITVTVGKRHAGPFTDPLYAFKYHAYAHAES